MSIIPPKFAAHWRARLRGAPEKPDDSYVTVSISVKKVYAILAALGASLREIGDFGDLDKLDWDKLDPEFREIFIMLASAVDDAEGQR
jgi:hypothetical protein